MRNVLAMILMTSPAMAHTGAGMHAHPADMAWLVGLSFLIGLSLTLRAAVLLRAKAKVRS